MENSRFKFRVWKGQENRMVYDVTYLNPLILDPAIKEENKHNILMQCTGLKDRNGKLIYEGDIVRFYSLYGHATFEIKWSEEFAAFGYEDDETDFSELGRLYDEAAYVEVIGNIYQDIELLKEKS